MLGRPTTEFSPRANGADSPVSAKAHLVGDEECRLPEVTDSARGGSECFQTGAFGTTHSGFRLRSPAPAKIRLPQGAARPPGRIGDPGRSARRALRVALA